jgi:hypothetical protein
MPIFESEFARHYYRHRAITRALKTLPRQKEMDTEEILTHARALVAEVDRRLAGGHPGIARESADRLLGVAIRLAAACHKQEVSGNGS